MTAPTTSSAAIPPAELMKLANARYALVAASGTYVGALNPGDDTPLDVAAGRLAVAARNLVDLTDRAPERLQPEGWRR